MTIPNLCSAEGCQNFVESKYNWLCDYCKAKAAMEDCEHKCYTPNCNNQSVSRYSVFCEKCIQDSMKKTENSNQDTSENIPSYYGSGKGWDSYKYATFHKFPPALAHAHKYITRAGKKEGESYEKAIENAIHALERDLEIRRELNDRLA